MPESGEGEPAENQEAGWPAVGRLARHWLGALQPGEQPPPTPDVLHEWYTTVAALSVGGAVEGVAAHLQKTYWQKPEPAPAPRTLHTRMGRAFQLLDSALRHALPFSAMALLFLAVETVSATHRGRDRTVIDSLYGGAAVAAAHAGYRISYSPTWPPARLGESVVGMWGLCGAFGVVQSVVVKHNRQQREAQEAAEADERAQQLRAEIMAARQDAVGDVLAHLQASLHTTAAGEGRRAEGPDGGEQEQQGHQAAGVPGGARQQQPLDAHGELGAGRGGEVQGGSPSQQQQQQQQDETQGTEGTAAGPSQQPRWKVWHVGAQVGRWLAGSSPPPPVELLPTSMPTSMADKGCKH